jgi:hypothetical protein
MQSGPATLFLDFCFFVQSALATLPAEFLKFQLLLGGAVLLGRIVVPSALTAF